MPTVPATGPLGFSTVFRVVYGYTAGSTSSVHAARTDTHPTSMSLFADSPGVTGSTNSPYPLSKFRGYTPAGPTADVRIINNSDSVNVTSLSMNFNIVSGLFPLGPSAEAYYSSGQYGTIMISVGCSAAASNQRITLVDSVGNVNCQGITAGSAGILFENAVVNSGFMITFTLGPTACS